MTPELTLTRVCKRCGKALPLHLRSDAVYCPPQRGQKRCRDLTKDGLIKQLEPWEQKSIQEREVLQRQLPEGAVGYRISIVLDNSLYIFPKVGARFHYNAYGKRLKGCHFTLSELARIPVTALYKIEYVSSDGRVLPCGNRFMELTKTPTGRLQSPPNPTARRVSQAILAGEQTTDSVRLYELASHLGISTTEMLPILARCGITARPHARSSVTRAESAIIAAEFQMAAAGGNSPGVDALPEAGTVAQTAPGARPVAQPSAMVVMNPPGLLEDAFRSIGAKIERVHGEYSDSTLASQRIIDGAMETSGSIEQEADELTGISFAGATTGSLATEEKERG